MQTQLGSKLFETRTAGGINPVESFETKEVTKHNRFNFNYCDALNKLFATDSSGAVDEKIANGKCSESFSSSHRDNEKES